MKKNWLLAVLAFFLAGGNVSGMGRYCDRPIRVALFEYGVLYRSDTGDGIDARLVDTLAKRTGCVVEYVVMPRVRIWLELERGTLDMATAAIPTPERKRYGYLLPYFRTRNMALLRDERASSWHSMADFEKSAAKVGMVRGFRHEPAVDAMIERLRLQGRVVDSADAQENLRVLQEGLVDLAFVQPVVYRSYLSDPQLAQLRILDWVPKDQESVGALILSRKTFSPQQARQWDALLASLLKDGAAGRIYGAFLPAAQARDAVYRGERPSDY